ncbi:MAG: PAS domain S-box protein [Alphaproteobacteria bacterium]|jgi:PAS domain S-box-containing protein|nr:PAS domain S-box protein [Alphaproteobacteria bacterium]
MAPNEVSTKTKGVSEKDILGAMLSSIVDVVIVIDDFGCIERINPAVRRVFGFDPDELIGESVKRLMPERYSVEHDSYIQNYLDTGEAKVIGKGREVEGRRKDGSEFTADLSISEFHVDGTRRFVGVLRDTDERKRAERIIEEQRRNLLELSTPAIQLWDEIVLMPLVGQIDTERATMLIERLLGMISETNASVAILDVTGVPVIDTNVSRHLLNAVAAAGMIGAQVILTGIKPSGAQTLVQLGVDLSTVTTKGSLRAGVNEALRIAGYRLVTAER